MTYTPITANSGSISDPWPGLGGMADRRAVRRLILMLATIAALRPRVRRRPVVLLLPALIGLRLYETACSAAGLKELADCHPC